MFRMRGMLKWKETHGEKRLEATLLMKLGVDEKMERKKKKQKNSLTVLLFFSLFFTYSPVNGDSVAMLMQGASSQEGEEDVGGGGWHCGEENSKWKDGGSGDSWRMTARF
jgi:hypothetical protein